MLVGFSQQETLNLGFVLLGTRQQGVPVFVWELTLPCYPDSQPETLPESIVSHKIKGKREITYLNKVHEWINVTSPLRI
ncbi:unnamed protein product [Schistosoma curassoni]|uniref:RWD domain-containing protein n=1 Tax=Schistosoma curassoni TaxID=6186 RepID=A0A183KEH6_9TREM|nr:unnamed protein product [Schistosoma curassoni]